MLEYDVDDRMEALARSFRSMFDQKRAVMVLVVEDPSRPDGVRTKINLMRQDWTSEIGPIHGDLSPETKAFLTAAVLTKQDSAQD